MSKFLKDNYFKVPKLDDRLKERGLDPDCTGRWSVVRVHGLFGEKLGLVMCPQTTWGPFELVKDENGNVAFDIGEDASLDTFGDALEMPRKPNEPTHEVTLVLQYRLVAVKKGHVDL